MWKINPESLNSFFPEIVNHSRKCEATDCKHIQENGCAVKSAVKTKAIRKDRYDSYLKLVKESIMVQKQEIPENSEIITENTPVYTTIESELQGRFKVYIKENQKSLNIENILIKLSLDEKIECLELICKLSYLELLDIAKNGEMFLTDKIRNLNNLKKLRIDENAIHTERDKDFIDELKVKGINIVIYSI